MQKVFKSIMNLHQSNTIRIREMWAKLLRKVWANINRVKCTIHLNITYRLCCWSESILVPTFPFKIIPCLKFQARVARDNICEKTGVSDNATSKSQVISQYKNPVPRKNTSSTWACRAIQISTQTQSKSIAGEEIGREEKWRGGGGRGGGWVVGMKAEVAAWVFVNWYLACSTGEFDADWYCLSGSIIIFVTIWLKTLSHKTKAKRSEGSRISGGGGQSTTLGTFLLKFNKKLKSYISNVPFFHLK